jgi:hypothetical protein
MTVASDEMSIGSLARAPPRRKERLPHCAVRDERRAIGLGRVGVVAAEQSHA